jgi:hypothetical protein
MTPRHSHRQLWFFWRGRITTRLKGIAEGWNAAHISLRQLDNRSQDVMML